MPACSRMEMTAVRVPMMLQKSQMNAMNRDFEIYGFRAFGNCLTKLSPMSALCTLVTSTPNR
jgi:hypothetical protein